MTAIHLDVPQTRRSAAGTGTVPSRAARNTGRALSTIAILFLTMDASMKLFQIQAVTDSSAQLGWPASAMFGIGALEAILLALYLIPRTAIFGAILWTGYLGGAVATHVRIGNPLFSHTLFPVYIAVLLWGGLWLRDASIRSFITRAR